MNQNSTLWYFAYGSNLDPDTFLQRRAMAPLRKQRGRLARFQICFDLPVGPGERGVANLIAADEGHTWGVCFELSIEDCKRLDRSEGVDLGVYDRHQVNIVDEGGNEIPAFTYISKHRAAARKPSPRYIGLILKGAREHRLPTDYVCYLESFEVAVDERTSS